MNSSKLIAIDFDGTIVEDKYPDIGKPLIFAFETMKKMQEDGHRLVLWTYRKGKRLDEAVEFCKKNGIEFYAVNKNFVEEDYTPDVPRKLKADIFIDDRNIGGFIGWGRIYQILNGEDVETVQKMFQKKKGVIGKLFGK